MFDPSTVRRRTSARRPQPVVAEQAELEGASTRRTERHALAPWLFGLILLVTAFVLVAEIFNSAIEALCDFVETRENPKIKVIKDMAAAAVGIAMVAWLGVIVVEVSELLHAFSGGPAQQP